MQITECYDDVGPGWRAILEELHGKLEELTPGYQVTQVKEKFGGLRVYLDYSFEASGTDSIDIGQQCSDMERAIRVAEDKAMVTCEMCGLLGTTLRTGNGWLKTLCSTCLQIRELRNKRN